MTTTPTDESVDRPARQRMRSFVRREGRITPAQQRAFEDHWARFGLDYNGQPRDYAAIFQRHAPLILEIGFGNGEQLLHAAQHETDTDFLGIEVHRPGVGRLMNGLAAAQCTNVRIYNHDAVEVIEHELAPASLAQARIYFPDPWPKKRHHRRRLIQQPFVDLLATRIASGGLLHLATDWAEYAEGMRELLDADTQWRNRSGHGQFAERPPWRIETHFEKRGVRLGYQARDLLYERV